MAEFDSRRNVQISLPVINRSVAWDVWIDWQQWREAQLLYPSLGYWEDKELKRIGEKNPAVEDFITRMSGQLREEAERQACKRAGVMVYKMISKQLALEGKTVPKVKMKAAEKLGEDYAQIQTEDEIENLTRALQLGKLVVRKLRELQNTNYAVSRVVVEIYSSLKIQPNEEQYIPDPRVIVGLCGCGVYELLNEAFQLER